MDKTTAQATLKQLQDSIAAATAQAKELQAIIDRPATLQGAFVDFESARGVPRYTIYSDGDIDPTASYCRDRFNIGRLFPNREAAQAQVEYEKLRQLARIAMAKDWGNEPISFDGSITRWCITLDQGEPRVVTFSYMWLPIAFRTRGAAEAFLASISVEQATTLIKGL